MDTLPDPLQERDPQPPELSNSTVESQGERFLPYLYMIMQSCWIYAICMLLYEKHFLQASAPFVPLWGLLTVMIGSYALTSAWQQRAHEESGSDTTSITLLFCVILLPTICSIWGGVYASDYNLFDIAWVGTLFADLFSFNQHSFHALLIFTFSVYLFYYGMRLTEQSIEPGRILRQGFIGMAILLTMTFFHTLTTTQDTLTFLLLIPCFLSLALLTHAIAQAAYMRHIHSQGMQGNISTQERLLTFISAAVGFCLFLIMLLFESTLGGAVVEGFQQVLIPLSTFYSWFVTILTWIIVVLASPIIWLLDALHYRHVALKFPNEPSSGAPPRLPDEYLSMARLIEEVLKVLLPLFTIVVLIVLVLLLWRHRRTRRERKRNQDVHESLWAWSLFLSQLRGIFLYLWRHLFPQRTQALAEPYLEEPTNTTPTARTIREMYRAFLTWAARGGYARKRYETPEEFKRRLDSRLPNAQSELETLTDAYTLIRYSNTTPDEASVTQVRMSWSQLQQKSFIEENAS